MTADLLSGALIDEPATWGCDCTCDCYARVDRPDESCDDCTRGWHEWPDEGGEG